MKKGDICIVDLSLGSGHEQYGERPAILISDTKTNIAVVIPLTTNLSSLKFPHTLVISPDKLNNLKRESVSLIFHIRAIDKTRISSVIGRISKKSQEKIDNILREMLIL